MKGWIERHALMAMAQSLCLKLYVKVSHNEVFATSSMAE